MARVQFVIRFGRIEDDGKLHYLFVSSKSHVQKLAHKFIYVIPDELESYKEEIDNWDGETTLEITHQDDDTFLFEASPVKLTTDFSHFTSFVDEFKFDDES